MDITYHYEKGFGYKLHENEGFSQKDFEDLLSSIQNIGNINSLIKIKEEFQSLINIIYAIDEQIDCPKHFTINNKNICEKCLITINKSFEVLKQKIAHPSNELKAHDTQKNLEEYLIRFENTTKIGAIDDGDYLNVIEEIRQLGKEQDNIYLITGLLTSLQLMIKVFLFTQKNKTINDTRISSDYMGLLSHILEHALIKTLGSYNLVE